MTKIYRAALFLAVSTLYAAPIHAEKSNDDQFLVSVYGVGGIKSCAAFVRETDEKRCGEIYVPSR